MIYPYLWRCQPYLAMETMVIHGDLPIVLVHSRLIQVPNLWPCFWTTWGADGPVGHWGGPSWSTGWSSFACFSGSERCRERRRALVAGAPLGHGMDEIEFRHRKWWSFLRSKIFQKFPECLGIRKRPRCKRLTASHMKLILSPLSPLSQPTLPR